MNPAENNSKRNNKERSWQAILDITQTMKNSAATEDWETVSTIAVKRHRDVTEHFKNFPVNPENAAFYHQHLTAFMTEELQLQTLATMARKDVMKNGAAMQKSRKAADSYNSIAFESTNARS